MKWKIEKKYIKTAIAALVVIVLALLFQHMLENNSGELPFLNTVRNTFMPIVGGFVFAYLLNPVLYFFEHYLFTPLANLIWKNKEQEKKRMHFSRALGIICTMICVFIVVVGGLYLVIPQVYQSLEKIVSDAPSYYDKAVKWVDSLDSKNSDFNKYLLMAFDRIYDQGIKYLNKNILPNMDKIVVSITSGIIVGLKMLLNIILMIIISVYVLAEKELLISGAKKMVYSIFARSQANGILRGIRYADKVFGGFINGKIIDSFIIGGICYVGMVIAGIEYPVLISIIVGVTNIIPYFGPFIGAIPSVLILTIVDWKQGLFFLIFILILQQVDGNIIGPIVLGDRLKLSSMWILFSILIGGGFFGVAGMILGAPCFACIYALVGVVSEMNLTKKNLPTDSKEYLNVGSISETGELIEVKPEETVSEDIQFFKMHYREKNKMKQEEKTAREETKNNAEDSEEEKNEDNNETNK